MADDYDFFDEKGHLWKRNSAPGVSQADDSNPGQGSMAQSQFNRQDFDFCSDHQDLPTQPTVNPTNRRGGTYHGAKPHRSGRAMGFLSNFCGVAAFLSGLLALARALAPERLAVLKIFPYSVMAVLALILAVLTLMLMAVARRKSANSSQRKLHSAAIVAAVLALLLAVAGFLVGNMAPQGVFKVPVVDHAPVASGKQMKKGLNQASGDCPTDWQEEDTSQYPGVKEVALCKQTRVAFITFDNKASAAMYHGLVQSKITQLLQDKADSPASKGDWRVLSGDLWMAFGTKDSMTALQKTWGGTMSKLS